MTYKKKPDLGYVCAELLGDLPFGNQLATMAGINPFAARSAIEDLMRGKTGNNVRL